MTQILRKYWSGLIELKDYGTVLYQLVAQNLILRYRRTFLGYLWTLINPIMMMGIMAVVFSRLFQMELKDFALFLFAGMIPWNYFSSVVTQSSSALVNNEGLIKKIYLPKTLFPASVAISQLIDSLFSFCALFVLVIYFGGHLSEKVIMLPFAFFLLFLFSLGIGFIASILTIFFRDMQHVIGIGMQALFFMTPIFYKRDAFGGKFSYLIQINPLASYIELFRAPLYHNAYPSMQILSSCVFLSFATFAVGYTLFFMNQHKIVYRL